MEAGGISFQLLVWTPVPELHCSVMAFLSRWLCDAEFHFHSGPCHTSWADLVSIALRPAFLQIPSPVKTTKLVPAFQMWCLELRVFPGRGEESSREGRSSWWFELKFIHLGEMLSKMSTPYMSAESPPTGLQR